MESNLNSDSEFTPVERINLLNVAEESSPESQIEKFSEDIPIDINNKPTDNSLVLPKWLVPNYFKDIFEKEFEDFEIVDLDVALATGKGENYVAVLHRVKVKIFDKKNNETIVKCLIVKSLPNEGGISEDMMKDFNIFPKEIAVYETVLQKFEELYQSIGEKIIFGPRCYKISHIPDPTDIIVMEDLMAKNFKMQNRQKGLDMPCMKICLKKLAAYHAASAVIYERYGKFESCFDEGMYSEKMRNMFTGMFDQMFGPMIDYVSNWHFGKPYAEKMKKWKAQNLFENMLACFKPVEDGFNVLNHGDLWLNNSMYKHNDNGDVVECIFVDFQMGFWGSPVIDLQYFIVSSAAKDLRIKGMNIFIAYYFKHLIKNLKKLNFEGKLPTLTELHIDILKRGIFPVQMSLGILPIALVDARDDANMENLMVDSEASRSFKNALYNNPEYVNIMEELLPYYDNLGFMDL